MEAEATAGELVEAVAVEGEEGVGGGDGLGGGDGAAFGCTAAGRLGGDGRWVDAEAVADEEGKFGVGDEGATGDAVAEEEGGGAVEGARSHSGNGVRGCSGRKAAF